MRAEDSPETVPGQADALVDQGAYRVLARKYRPETFDDLIGQQAMVRTLRNAFAANRIHQAYIFTGVRGVGKTTTARILARALNYETDTILAPTIDMPVLGKHCQAIMESRHVDIIEMDAASNTSIANVREIIEAARYKPISARTKVYIIDEVHMLSNAAFNGLLKTLEEPPPHVKFLFATTEIRKVPVTILSRCQRFDLRRIEADEMIAYLHRIIASEGVSVEDEALGLIARASEGSMRDALSLLDQAIAHGAGAVKAGEVRAALGLADRARVIDLFEMLMRGDIASALLAFDAQHSEGADPGAILTDLGEFVHLVTRLKIVPEAARDPSLSETERLRGKNFAETLSIRALTMAWQILLKGLGEVNGAARAKIAAEMVLVRLAYAADLPPPGDLIRDLRNAPPAMNAPMPGVPNAPGSPSTHAVSTQNAPRLVSDQGTSSALRKPAAMEAAQPLALPATFLDLVALADRQRDIRMKLALERDIRVVKYEPGRLEIALEPKADAELPNRLSKALFDWTGTRWGVSVVQIAQATGAPLTLHEEAEAAKIAEAGSLRAHPALRAILAQFPDALIEGQFDAEIETAAPAEDPDEPDITSDDLS